MSSRSFRLLVVLLTGTALVLLATALLASAPVPAEETADPMPAIALSASGMSQSVRPEPDAAIIIAPPVAAYTRVPPTATPSSETEIPRPWVRTEGPAIFVPALQEDVDESEKWDLPPGTYLKVLHDDGSTLHVLYGGDGDEYDPAEGWIQASQVRPSAAPAWVVTTRPAALRPSTGSDGGMGTGIPASATLEVLEDLGSTLRVFYLGDGLARDPMEGRVHVDEVGPAGPLLAEEAEGVRQLRSSDISSFDNGTGVWLRVPYRTQLDGSRSELSNCGPASIGMVLAASGRHIKTGEIRAIAERLQGTSDPDSGFAIEFLKGAADHFGAAGQELLEGKKLRSWNLDDVRRHLKEGHPVIPQLRFRLMAGRSDSDYYEDHYVVLTGFIGDDFIYNDSIDIDGPGYGRLMDAETLTRAWGGSYFPFAAFAVDLR